MAIEIPLTRPLTNENSRVSQPTTRALGGGLRRTVIEKQIVAAVTGGVAISDPKRAIELARKDRDKGEDVIAPNIDTAKLNVLFDAVEAVRKGEETCPELSDADRHVARSLRVDARLVAAARAAATADASVRKAGTDWAASINAQRLASVARIGSNENQLDRIPSPEKKIEDLDDRVESIEKGLEAVMGSIDALTKKVNELAKQLPKVAKP